MEQEVETSREGSAAPHAGNISAESHADDSDDSLWKCREASSAKWSECEL